MDPTNADCVEKCYNDLIYDASTTCDFTLWSAAVGTEDCPYNPNSDNMICSSYCGVGTIDLNKCYDPVDGDCNYMALGTEDLLYPLYLDPDCYSHCITYPD